MGEIARLCLRAWRLGNRVSIAVKTGFCLSLGSTPTLRPTEPPSQWVPGSVPLGVKRTVLEAYHSPPSSAEDKNDGAIPPFPHTSSWRGTLSNTGIAVYFMCFLFTRTIILYQEVALDWNHFRTPKNVLWRTVRRQILQYMGLGADIECHWII
jgi:hypothetical protein